MFANPLKRYPPHISYTLLPNYRVNLHTFEITDQLHKNEDYCFRNNFTICRPIGLPMWFFLWLLRSEMISAHPRKLIKIVLPKQKSSSVNINATLKTSKHRLTCKRNSHRFTHFAEWTYKIKCQITGMWSSKEISEIKALFHMVKQIFAFI